MGTQVLKKLSVEVSNRVVNASLPEEETKFTKNPEEEVKVFKS